MKRAFQFVLAAALLSGLPSHARADELKLKDGTKLIGTIVGFDDNSFKVKTTYGFAIVQKDQVVSISISDAAKKPEPEKKPEPAATKSPSPAKSPSAVKPANAEAPSATASTAPASAPETKLEAPPAIAKTPAEPANKPVASSNAPAPATVNPPNASNAVNAKNSVPAPAPSPAPVEPPAPPQPVPMKEVVSGNTYTNETYGFHMYKPPDWQLIEGARSVVPGSITAMGTADQRTYLVIGQEPAGKSLASDVDATEHRLREVLDNYRPLGEKHIMVSGVSAVEHLFRGSVEQHDWSGVIVFLPRDSHLYTIFGMTYAETDLVQIQENVIARAISSLQFTRQ
jgi:hypothetical protein